MSLKQNPTSDIVVNGKAYNTFTEPPVALAEERARTSFPVRELTYYFDGGKAETEAYEKLTERIERDTLFNNNDFYDLDHEALRERTFAMVGRLHQHLEQIGLETPNTRRYLSPFGLVHPSAQTRLSVHFGLFASAIRGQGTDKQYQYWKSRGLVSLSRFYGCFAMTELGHGSNVAGLETTATYDKATQEFVINTPQVTATKWWIGGAAHSANHCVCFARLIVDGKDYGVRNFVVPLRDVDRHEVLPGISLGDNGKKMGRDGIDNGWIQFSQVRIPRTYMLMRYSQVTEDGKVIEPPLAQLTYGALINGRVSMAYDSWVWARRFLLIAIRYAAVRRQFSSSPEEPETKLLDYVYHQRRLMPLLAQAIAIEAASSELYSMFDRVDELQRSLDPKDTKAVKEAVGSVKELFAISAGLKAFSTWAAATSIDEARQACGGLGYSGYNGFGQGYDDWVVNCTWEGDNNVLCLSAGRALIQSGLVIAKGGKTTGVTAYLNNYKQLSQFKLGNKNIVDPAVAIEAFQSVAAQGIMATVAQYQEIAKSGLKPAQIFEQLSNERFSIARLHTRAFQVRALWTKVSKAKPELQDVLTRVASLFTVWAIDQESAAFLRYGVITGDDLNKIAVLSNEYCAKVRDQAIGITDAFNLSDFYVNAPIANHDGNAYHNYFKKVNDRKPAGAAKAPYLNSVMLPFFKRGQSEAPSLDEI